MKRRPTTPHARTLPRALTRLALLLTILAAALPAAAQLNGTYTIGGSSPSYTSIDQAIAALSAGVSGPVTFLIRSGTYTSSSSGWTLPAVAGASSASPITFRPAPGATVLLQGNTATGTAGVFSTNAVIVIEGGDHYVIDGSSTPGGSTRDMTIRQLERHINQPTYNPAIWLRNDADSNTIRNCVVQSSAAWSNATWGGAALYIGGSTGTSGNDNNVVAGNLIGDPAGVHRAYAGVLLAGTSAAVANTGNVVHGNDVVNFRVQGINVSSFSTGTVVRRNRIWMTHPGQAQGGAADGIVVVENTLPASTRIDSNRIWSLKANQNGVSRLILLQAVSTTGGTTVIANNMLSLSLDGYNGALASQSAIGMLSAGVVNYTVAYNSIHADGVAQGATQTSLLSKANANAVVTHRNNVYYSTRSGGTATNYAFSITGATATWISSNNVVNVYTDGVGHRVALVGGTAYLTLAALQAAGLEPGSVAVNPRFVDPASGDLHISTTRPTPVESRGVPVAGLTADHDGEPRDPVTPDIGADEGGFLPLPTVDAGADRVISPASGTMQAAGVAFAPIVFVENTSATTQTVPVRLRIRSSAGAIVYESVQSVSIAALTAQRLLFPTTGTVTGSTALAAGAYTLELETMLAGDLDATNNSATSTLVVGAPMSGTYTIDRLGSGARNFTSFTDASTALNTFGVNGPVVIQIAGGRYDSTSERFPMAIRAVAGASAVNTITFRPAPGARIVYGNDAIGPVIELNDADYVTLDGSSVPGGRSRDWRIFSGSHQRETIRLAGGAQFNTLRNLNVMSASLNTPGAISLVGLAGQTSANQDNRIVDNTFGDSTGVYRSAVGILLNAPTAFPNRRTAIDSNDFVNLGTTWNNFAGNVYMFPGNEQTKIRHNQIRQLSTAGQAFTTAYGVYIQNTSGGGDTIAYNRMWNLGSGAPGQTVYGVFGVQWVGDLVVHNNMIAASVPNGGGALGVATSTLFGANARLFVDHNTVHLSGATDNTSAVSAGVSLSGSGAATVRNNVIVQAQGGNGLKTTLHRAATTGSLVSTNNLLLATGGGASIGNVAGTAYPTLAAWQALGYDAGSVTGPAPLMNPTAGDLHVALQVVFAGEGRAVPIGYPLDYDLQARDPIGPDMGADEGNFNGGGIVLLSPNTSTPQIAGETVPVQFTANRVMNGGVFIEITVDGGASWQRLATLPTTLAGANVASVTMPNVMVPAARLRVISQRTPFEGDSSDVTFPILRKLRITAPTASPGWLVGDTVRIAWERIAGERPGQTVDVELSTNGGGAWATLAAGVPYADGGLTWIVPNTPTPNAIIRITNRDVARAWDSSEVFPILLGELAVTSPNGGERYEIGEPITATWASANVATVRLDVSIDGGNWWQTVATVPAAGGAYTFVPPGFPTKRAKIRLTDVDRPRIADSSDGLFELMSPPAIMIHAPTTGEQLMRGATYTISWSVERVARVDVRYSSNAGTTWLTLASSVDARTGQHVWTVPAQTTAQGRIRIEEVGGGAFAETGLFSVVEPRPMVRVIRPNGGERYFVGEPIAVQWTAADVGTLTLSFSSNGGATWTPFAGPLNATLGTWTWPANLAPGSYRVRIDAGGGIRDDGDADFTVVRRASPSITVESPNGGELYRVDSAATVRWRSQDVSGPVAVSWSSDAGATWTPIGSADVATGSLAWTIPDDTTSTALVRVVGGGVGDTSDALFSIVAPTATAMLRVVAPNGGERWREGDTATIAWASLGVTSVDLQLSTDGGASWTRTIATGLAADAGSYRWRVPRLADTSLASLLLRAAASENPSLWDASDGTFSYLASVVATADPVTGERLLMLVGAMPNPFAGATEIRWQQARAATAELRVFAPSGEVLVRHDLGVREPGAQRVAIDGSSLASGTYVYELRVGGAVARGVMTRVR